jgi:hypothetical protein
MPYDEDWWRRAEGARYSRLNRDLVEHYLELHGLVEILTTDANRRIPNEEVGASETSIPESPGLSIRTLSEDSLASDNTVMTAPPTTRQNCLDAAAVLCYLTFIGFLWAIIAYDAYLVIEGNQRSTAALLRRQNDTN